MNVVDIEKLCKDFRIEYASEGHHHCHVGWTQVHCPWCSGGKHGFHLGFNLEHGNMNCWRCGSHSIWDYIGTILNTTRKDLIAQTLYKYKGKAQKKKQEPIPRKTILKPPPGTCPFSLAHKKYLRRRGFNTTALKRDWGLKGTRHLSGEWNWRIIIPIHNQDGKIVSYQGRAIKEGVKPKYKFIPKKDMLQDPKSLLYGLHKMDGSFVIIVEGVTGVWKLGTGTVATLGMDWKIPQAEILRRFKRRFILFDPGQQAQRKAYELAKWLSFFPGETEILDGFTHDPGEMREEEIKNFRKELDFER